MVRQRLIFSFFWITIFVLLPDSGFTLKPGAPFTVVIDPGHGGHDPGALGRFSKEKSINLSIALKLGNMIQKNLPGVKVIYTRDRDKFVEVFRRAEIANKNKADLFISIHCNANENRSLKGAETYVMGLHRSKANLAIAKLENASILLESDYKTSYEGFDPNSDESYILFNLHQNENLDRSTGFAAAIQEQLTERVGMKDRGVRQAGFLVLYKTAMPSVLVETGYISNAADEKFISSAQGQDYIANAIYRAFRDYHKSSLAPITTTEPIGQDTPLSSKPGEITVPIEKPASTTPKSKPPVTVPSEKKTGEYDIRIQVATTSSPLPETAPVYRKFKKVSMYRHNGLYKYTVGNFSDPEKAKSMLVSVKQSGFPDAFLVVFRNGERLQQQEADRLLKP